MKMIQKKKVSKYIALFLCFVLSSPVCVNAAGIEDNPVMPAASIYLDSYQGYVYPAGSGEIQVWFDVTGVDYMDELGALSIWLYESTDNTTWTQVEYFHYLDNPGMLKYNAISNMNHVTYQGIVGRYYRARICIWGGKDGEGDSRYLWTSPKKAT